MVERRNRSVWTVGCLLAAITVLMAVGIGGSLLVRGSPLALEANAFALVALAVLPIVLAGVGSFGCYTVGQKTMDHRVG